MVRLLVLALGLASSYALASDDVSPLEFLDADIRGSELKLKLAETEVVPNACDLVLSNSNYVPALKALVLEFKAVEHCPIERKGKRQAHFSWRLPFSNRRAGEWTLIANQKKLGVIRLAGGEPTFEESE